MNLETHTTEVTRNESNRTWLWIALGAAAFAGIAAVALSRRKECAESVDMLLETCNNAMNALDERMLKAAS